MGVFGFQTLVGRHRDSNPGPPACKSGVIAITLRGPPLVGIKNVSGIFLKKALKFNIELKLIQVRLTARRRIALMQQ